MSPEKGYATTGRYPAPEAPTLRGGDFGEVAEKIRRREVSRVLHRLGLSPEAEEAVAGMTRSLVDKLVEGPIANAVAFAGSPQPGTTQPDSSDDAEGERGAPIPSVEDPGEGPTTERKDPLASPEKADSERKFAGAVEPYNYNRFRMEAYRLEGFAGPDVGEPAPDFAAETADGRQVRLSHFRGRPVVLETGSYSCPMYVGNIGAMDRLARRYPEARFLVLYVREAHPGSRVSAHGSMGEKTALARRVATEEPEGREILVDDLEGSAHRAYGNLPDMVYLIGEDGTVLLREQWNDPEIVEEALGRLRRGEPLRGIRPGTNRPPSPRTTLRVLLRAGRDSLGDFLLQFPRMVLAEIRQALKRRRNG